MCPISVYFCRFSSLFFLLIPLTFCWFSCQNCEHQQNKENYVSGVVHRRIQFVEFFEAQQNERCCKVRTKDVAKDPSDQILDRSGNFVANKGRQNISASFGNHVHDACSKEKVEKSGVKPVPNCRYKESHHGCLRGTISFSLLLIF